METFEKKAKEVFGEIVINKSFVHKAGIGSRAIPTYVREWIISNYVSPELELTEASRDKIARFVYKYVPDKADKETIKNKLFEQIEVQILDNFAVYVNLAKGDRYLQIPFLDENAAFVTPSIVQENEMLLSSGLWGVGELYYIPPSDDSPKGQVWMRKFRPFQLANVDIEYFCESRREFTTEEWMDLLVSSMGFNHHLYSERQKVLLLSRLIPVVEPRYNLVELAPKGTGKSFVFDNMSRYVAVRSGQVTPAVLFFNDARKTPGIITRYDCVVIDEAQKVRPDNSGELSALLKSYLESGRFSRGSATDMTAEAGLVMLANIDLDSKKQPIHEEIGLFSMFPNFLCETAFIDRFSGLLPGWDLPRIAKDTPSKSLGLKGDIFGEILHAFRRDISFRDYVKTNIELINCDDMRDNRGIESGATGLLKILFPNKGPTEEEFYHYCVNPALEMRQRIRDELCKLDREYTPLTMQSKYPDNFQRNHKLPSFVDPEKASINDIDTIIETEPSEVEDEIRNEIDYPEPIEQTLHIKDGDTGYSYENLFGPYLQGANTIYLIDPYIRLDYQIQNLLAFTNIFDTAGGPVELRLITGAKDAYEEKILTDKFLKIKDNLMRHNIIFNFEFNQSVHDRKLDTNTGWHIILGRGLDIYQKPESKLELSAVDQAKKECRETEIVFIKKK